MPRRDIGLIMCPVWDTKSPQLGLPLLKAYLKSVGYDAFTFDLAIKLYRAAGEAHREAFENVDAALFTNPVKVRRLFDAYPKVIEASLDELLDSGAATFGFSLYFCNLPSVLEFARRLKARDPSRAVVFGGPECVRFKAGVFGASRGDSSLFDVADALVPGEGETALEDFLREASSGRARPTPGAFVKVDGAFQWGGPAREIKDLDALPLPDFSDYRLEDYSGSELVTFMTRGCIRHCTFCDVEFYWGKYRTRSGARVFEDVSRQLADYPGTDSFWFCDSIVNANMKELAIFCDLMIERAKRGSPAVKWRAYAIIRGDMTRAFAEKMAAAGCKQLFIGIESGSQKVLNLMKKGFHVAVAEQVLRDIHAAGIKTNMLLMVGFPGEEEEDFQETLAFLGRAGRYAELISPSEGLTYIGLGTDVYENAGVKYGVETPVPSYDYWRTSDGKNDYPERLNRYERLCAETKRLGLTLSHKSGLVEQNVARMRYEYERHLIQQANDLKRANGTCFRLRLLLSPAYLRERLRTIRSASDLGTRLANVFFYIFRLAFPRISL